MEISQKTSQLERVAVDLTPITPGGENGGAKVFILELVDQLASDRPETQFLLLIHERVALELNFLVRDNVHLINVIGEGYKPRREAQSIRLVKKLLRALPRQFFNLARRFLFITSRFLRKGKPSQYRGNMDFLKQLEADLLFCPFTAPNFWDPAIPTVSTIHDLQYKSYSQFFSSEDVAHRDRIFQEAIRYSTLITSVSDYTRQSAIRHGRFSENRIRTVYHRLAERVKLSEDNIDSILDDWKLTPQRFLVYPANFWPHKNHEMLLTAFSMVLRSGEHPDLKLVLTGAPTDRQAFLSHAAKEMGLEHQVIFTGYVSNEYLGFLLRSSTGMIFPSLYEGFGMPIIEAMAMGVPVASSTSASLSEVAGGAALLFDARKPREIQNAIQRLIEDPILCKRLIVQGKERAKFFSDKSQMSKEYWDIFIDAMKRHGSENHVTGPYPDGWLGTVVTFQIAHQELPSRLEIKLSSPGRAPILRSRIDININGMVFKSLWIKRGRSRNIQVPLSAGASTVELHLSPSFDSDQHNCVKKLGPLTIKLDGCDLITNDNRILNLYLPRYQ